MSIGGENMSFLDANICISLPFIITGVVLLFVYFRNFRKVRASQAWSAVGGTVVESWVRREESADSEGGVSYSYYPEIRYQYKVMGNEYQGDKIYFGGKTGGLRSMAERKIAKYPTGANVMIYYQPDNPTNAVLERSVSWVLLVFGIIFVLAGIFIYAFLG
jgi:hypothetical protein